MRLKLATMAVVVVVLLVAAGLAQAQGGGGPLTPDQWTNGTLTLESCVHTYSFQGTGGSLVTIAAYAATGTFDLDPALVLADSSGNVLAWNDDFSGFEAVIITALPADDEYRAIVMPSDLYVSQPDNSAPLSSWTLQCTADNSVGDYTLRLGAPSLLEPGQSVEVTLDSDTDQEQASLFVLMPESDVTWAINFEQPGGELFAEFELTGMNSDTFFGNETVFDFSGTAGVRSGTLNVDLTGGVFYVLTVQQSLYSYSFEEITAVVKVTLSAAQ